MRLIRVLIVIAVVAVPLWGAATELVSDHEVGDTGITIDDIVRLSVITLVGALGYMISMFVSNMLNAWRQHSKAYKELSEAVSSLTLEAKLIRQQTKGYDHELKIIKKRLNKHGHWINGHIVTHAKCTDCPESNVIGDEENGD